MRGKVWLTILLWHLCCPFWVSAGNLTISVQIDGHSRLILSQPQRLPPTQVMWDHLSGARPGTVGGSYPTLLTGYSWFPTWPNDAPNESRSYTGIFPMSVPTNEVYLTQNSGRTRATILQQSTVGSEFMLIVDFDDSAWPGADQYTITLHGISYSILSSPLVGHDLDPFLNGPVFTNGQFSFDVQGASKAGYIALTTADLLSWMPVATNQGSASTRTISIPASENQSFIKVERMPLPVFPFALAAVGRIDIASSSFSVDSFDSGDTNYSTGGRYDPAKKKDNGDIASLTAITNSGNFGNPQIFGSLFVGGNGAASIGTNGSVGSLAWQRSGNIGIEPGHLQTDFVFDFGDVIVPFASGGYYTNDNGAATLDGVFYDYTFTGGNYKINSLYLPATTKAVILGDVSIWVPGTLTFSGNGKIDIAPGARLKIYSGGPVSLGGHGISNANDATACVVYGLPTCTSISFLNSWTFTGCIYAPKADFVISAGGLIPFDYSGAVIARTVRKNGNGNFHYDENLQRIGPMR